MKVLGEQVEGKMNSRAEYPSNHSRQQRKWNVDNLTFSNCGDTGFANPQLQIAPSSMKHSLDYLNQVEIKKKRKIDLLLCQTTNVTWSPTLGIVWHFCAPRNIQLLRDMPSNFPQDSRLRCLWYVFF